MLRLDNAPMRPISRSRSWPLCCRRPERRGHRYVDSAVICNIPGGPEHLFREYHPTTWPGARLPHVWLGDGTPLQDKIPDGYAILRLGGTKADTSGIERAIAARGAPV